MKRLFLSLLLLLAVDVHAARPAGAVMIQGVDAQCQSFTAGTSGTTTTYTCVGGVTPGAPTNCIATVNSTSVVNFPAAGGTANLHVVCDQTSGVTYNWSRNGTSGISALTSFSQSLPSNGTASPVVYSYQVAACIGANCVTVPAVALTATVAATGSFTGTCPGFDNTYVVTMPWLGSTRQIQPMGPNDILIVQFTAGTTTQTNNLPKIGVAEYGSPPSSRYGTLSPNPCDFSQQPAFAANIGPSNSMSVYFAVAPTAGVYLGYYPQIGYSQTWYFNVKNVVPSSCSAQGICQVSIDLLGTR